MTLKWLCNKAAEILPNDRSMKIFIESGFAEVYLITEDGETIKCTNKELTIEEQALELLGLANAPNEDSTEAPPVSLSALVRRLAELARRTHFNCEGDSWFNCPKHEHYIRDDGKTECECGADIVNSEVDEIMKKAFPAA